LKVPLLKIPKEDREFLEWIGYGPGTYPAGGPPDFVFPVDNPDFYIRFFEQDGEYFAEIPDSIEPAFYGNKLTIFAGGDVSKEWEGKVYAIFT
jgi:hypothetical protein